MISMVKLFYENNQIILAISYFYKNNSIIDVWQGPEKVSEMNILSEV